MGSCLMRNASSTARQRIGQGKPSLSDSQTGYGRPAVSGVRMSTDRTGTSSASRLTFDSAVFLIGVVCLSSVGASGASAISLGLATVGTVT